MKKTLLWCAAIGAFGAAVSSIVVYGGLYDVSATDQHLAPTYKLLDFAMRRSIARRGASISVPALDEPKRIGRGLALYRTHCVQCHGAPGVAPAPFALGLTPAPANLAYAGREWPPADIYWTVKHGLKMTGMPAWAFRMNEEELWDVVAFVRAMPLWSPAEYRARAATVAEHRHDHPSAATPTRADAARGRVALQQYACATCHQIPGVVGSQAAVGPPLTGMGQRGFIGGVLPNTSENMVRWLRSPQAVNPDTAMPGLGVSERDARDMAAYLETLR
jgi:mono/diheme cytochrome c family protein